MSFLDSLTFSILTLAATAIVDPYLSEVLLVSSLMLLLSGPAAAVLPLPSWFHEPR